MRHHWKMKMCHSSGLDRTESENPQWIEKLVFVDSGKFDHKWLRVIKCSADFVNETLLFFRRINPETKYRIAPE